MEATNTATIDSSGRAVNEFHGDHHQSSSSDETYMSSAEWLKRHGLLARRLGFYDVLAGVTFRHEDGVLDLKVAPPCADDEVVDAVSI